MWFGAIGDAIPGKNFGSFDLVPLFLYQCSNFSWSCGLGFFKKSSWIKVFTEKNLSRMTLEKFLVYLIKIKLIWNEANICDLFTFLFHFAVFKNTFNATYTVDNILNTMVIGQVFIRVLVLKFQMKLYWNRII